MCTLLLTFSFLLAPISFQGGPPQHVFGPPRLPSVEIQDTGLAVDPGGIVADGRWILFSVRESGMDADLNGDGDSVDNVVHLHDLVAGSTINLGLGGGAIQVGDGVALILVTETWQGNTDLNGDGDALDSVFFAVDLVSASVRNSGLAASSSGNDPRGVFDGRFAVLVVDENQQGRVDLSGDGYLTKVAFAWDLHGAESPVNLHRALAYPYVEVHESFLLLAVDEGVGQDLNGDDDEFDEVLAVYAAETGTLVNTGLALGSAFSVFGGIGPIQPGLEASGRHSAFLVRESSQGLDLNGDGLVNSSVLHVFDLDTGLLENLGLAAGAPSVSLGAPGPQYPTGMKLADQFVVFQVPEMFQGQTDLNGDGVANDTALFLHDFSSGVTRNVGISAWEFTQADGLLAFEAWELPQEQDWNGDGDTNDFVAQIHSIAPGTTWNLGLATPRTHHSAGVGHGRFSPFHVRGSWVAFSALENGVDYNGDGDGTDVVLFLAEPSSQQLVATGMVLATDPYLSFSDSMLFHDASGGLLTFLASESGQGEDLNRDGDRSDQVLHFLRPSHGKPINTAASALGPMLPAYRRWIPFLAQESDDEVDRTGDGDLTDTVLRVARRLF